MRTAGLTLWEGEMLIYRRPLARAARRCAWLFLFLVGFGAASLLGQAPMLAMADTTTKVVCPPAARTGWSATATGSGDACQSKLYVRTTLSGAAPASVDYTFAGLTAPSYHVWVWVGHTYANAGNVHYHVDANNFSHGGYVDQERYTDRWVQLNDYGAVAFAPESGKIHVSVDNTDVSAVNRGCASGNGTCYVSADAMAVSTDGPPGTPPPTTLNDYPWNGLRAGGDPWGMGYGECVSYAAWKIYENKGGKQHPPFLPDAGWRPTDAGISPVTYYWGNSDAWAASARQRGIPVDSAPRVGDIAQWGDIPGTFAIGHVAYVYAVNGDGSIELAQYNLRLNQQFSTLHMPRGGAYDTSFGLGRFFVPFPQNFIHAGD